MSKKGVIVIQEWWGVDAHIKAVCKRFEEEGFKAIAPDLYDGEVTKSPDEAGRKMMALNIDKTAEKLALSVKELKKSCDKVAVVGFCMGGQLALFAASKNPEIDACVDFYGIHPNIEPDFENLRCPVIGFFGKRDEFITPAKVKELDAIMQKAGVKHTFHSFDAPHAFFNDNRPEVYTKEAADVSWKMMLDLFFAM
ncbi:MAG: Carboxymethylenebutenolidase [Chlamydiia bacterium]|nr:Carboxymethylenebutenolidase [Chlamydiia bacterium]MCH9615463.1 Carboxymethylenebutenolidase [Chlamydiia bacterium]MCH9629118.1 Carboxymethylenebutenolidase [Chlamydiia bacterium]